MNKLLFLLAMAGLLSSCTPDSKDSTSNGRTVKGDNVKPLNKV